MVDEPGPALTGAAFELAKAGYQRMPDPDKKSDEEAIGGDAASLREAAERRSDPPDEIVVRQYTDGSGKPVAPDEAITLNRAARDYARAASADKFAVENESSRALAARVDGMRAEALALDPEAAEFYGFELPTDEAEQTASEEADSEKPQIEPEDPSGDRAADGLDPEIAKVINHPQVRQAIDEKVGEAEKARESYLNGLAAATQIAQVSFVSQFPELASIAPEHLPGALELMSRQDPQKFARVQAMIATTEQLFAQRQQESRQ